MLIDIDALGAEWDFYSDVPQERQNDNLEDAAMATNLPNLLCPHPDNIGRRLNSNHVMWPGVGRNLKTQPALTAATWTEADQRPELKSLRHAPTPNAVDTYVNMHK